MAIGCGPGGSCCGKCAGLGEAPFGVAQAEVERILTVYVMRKAAAGEPFYISRDVNSDVMARDNGLGFFPAIFAAIASVAAKVIAVAPTVAKVAGDAAAVSSEVNNLYASSGAAANNASTPTAAQVAAAIAPQVAAQLKAQGITLPADIQTQVVSASLLDTFGVSNRPYVIAGLAGLALLLLLRR